MTRCRLRLPIILALPLLVMLLVMLVYSKLHLLLIWHSQLIQQMGWSNGSAFWNFGLVNLGKETAQTPTPAPPATATNSQVPRTSPREEQVAALNTLQKLLHSRPVSYTCKDIRVLWNREAGSWRYCNDGDYVVQEPCLVYSFGVNYDFGFEDGMAELGCEVLSFDPSMKMADHRRSPQVMFYAIGLGHEDTDTFDPHLDSYVKEKTAWKIRTLESLLRQQNHTERVIDVLKMDIETYEWNVTRNMLDTGVLKNVKQLLLEWHVFNTYPAREEFPRMAATVQDLDMAGFQDFFKNAHTRLMGWNKLQFQSDMCYVNSNMTRAHN